MRLTWTIARKSLAERPGRTLFSVLGIAVGIATVVAIFTLDHNTILGLSHPDSPDWQADIEVSANAETGDARRDLLSLPGVDRVSAFFQNEVLVVRDGAPRPQRGRLFALEAEHADALGVYRVKTGQGLAARTPHPPVLLGEALAEATGLKVGDEVRLVRPPRAGKKDCVEGVLKRVRPERRLPPRQRPFTVGGILAHEKLGRRSRGFLVVIGYRTALDLYERPGAAASYIVKKDDGVDVERLRSSLGEAYSYDINRNVIVGQAADERAFRNGVRFAGLLALVLGLFVIFHTLSIALLERMKEIATLHALGTSRTQIAKIFFVEALVLSGLGGAIGLAAGLVLAWVLLALGITTLGVGKWVRVFDVPWSVVAPLTLTGCGIALVGSIYPLLRMRRASTVTALRGESTLHAQEVSRGFRLFSAMLLAVVLPALYFVIVPVVGEAKTALTGSLLLGAGIVALLVGLPLLVPEVLGRVSARLAEAFAHRWPLAGRLAGRAVQEKPARIAAAIVVLAMVCAAFTALKGMTNSLRAEVEDWADRAVGSKVFISELGDSELGPLRDRLKQLPGVAAVEPGSARTYEPFLIVGLPAEELRTFGPLRDPELYRRFVQERGIILSGRLARDLEYRVGSDVQIRTARRGPEGGDHIVEGFPVLAVSDAYGFFPHPDERMYGVISAEVMRRDFCITTTSVTHVAVKLEDGIDPAAALARIEQACLEHDESAREWRFDTGADIRDYAVEDIRRDFSLFDIILALTALLAGLGILNGQLLAALERVKELGILKALGVTRRQIAGMVLLESLVVGLLGCGLGVSLGVLLTPVVVEALQVVSALDLPHRGPGAFLFVAVFAGVALTLIAAIYPIYRMNRLDTVAAIRNG